MDVDHHRTGSCGSLSRGITWHVDGLGGYLGNSPFVVKARDDDHHTFAAMFWSSRCTRLHPLNLHIGETLSFDVRAFDLPCDSPIQLLEKVRISAN